MADDKWWSGEDEPAEPNSPRVPEHWLRPPADGAASGRSGRQRVPGTAPETVSSALPAPTFEEIPATPGAPGETDSERAPARGRGLVIALVAGGVIVVIALIVAIGGGGSGTSTLIEPASVAVPPGFVQDTSVDRSDAGLSDAFSDPLAYRNGSDLLLIYSRSVETGEVARERAAVTEPGDFADELAAGLPGYAVLEDESADIGDGGRLVQLANGEARLVAVRFLLRNGERSAVVVVAAGGSSPVDVAGVARGLRLQGT